MIGVIARSSDHPVVKEFFELFKTPWEFYRSGGQYDVVLCAENGEVREATAQLVLIYGVHSCSHDAENGLSTNSHQGNNLLLYRGREIPIYGSCVVFQEERDSTLNDSASGYSAMSVRGSSRGAVVRIGYDLFGEVRGLLTTGQPPANAASPTLELHIAVLRDLIIESGVPLVEIPPVPDGYRFIACLTHDVDHPSIRQHVLDHTTLGFLYRATLVSLWSLLHGRLQFAKALKNWWAVLKLPFVYLGLANDFWLQFDRYTKLEDGAHSTFFVVPFPDCPGEGKRGPAPNYRASRYGIQQIADSVHRLMSEGCEIGLHGIDAWCDSSKGQRELDEVRRVTGDREVGVRMHWLYADEQTPAMLEKAGAVYDSTVGYNETIGYRAGTTQAYRPFGVARLLELPLHVMDTALFFPSYLDLSAAEARDRIAGIINNAAHYGGSFVVNWHDRSIAPERLWDDTYVDLVGELKARNAWLATAGDAVGWFRKRRSVEFQNVDLASGTARIRIDTKSSDQLPGLQVLLHHGKTTRQIPVDTVIEESRSTSNAATSCVVVS